MTRLLWMLLFFLLSCAASAAPHRIEVKVFEGFRPYAVTFKAEDGRYTDAVGTPRGASDHELAFSYTLKPDGDAFNLDFYLNLKMPGGGRGISQTGSVKLPAGAQAKVLDCGRWKVEIGLDLPAQASGKSVAPANYWLTVNTSGNIGRQRCRLAVGLSRGGSMSDFVSPSSGYDQKMLFSFRASFPTLTEEGAPEPLDAGTYHMTYGAQAGQAMLQSGVNLVLGRPKSVVAGDGRIELVLVKEPRSKGKAASASEGAGERSVVPLLR